jgi:spectinomycin phosphotransferase
MLEKPDLGDEVILARLRAAYRLPLTDITFLPLGDDSASWSYRVQSQDGAAYFLKVRKGQLNLPSLIVPRYLKDHGVEHVIAPFEANGEPLASSSRPFEANGEPLASNTPPDATAPGVWTELSGYNLILYPFLEGRSGAVAGLAGHHWITYGTVLR